MLRKLSTSLCHRILSVPYSLIKPHHITQAKEREGSMFSVIEIFILPRTLVLPCRLLFHALLVLKHLLEEALGGCCWRRARVRGP